MPESLQPAAATCAHEVLRRETRAWHDRVEDAFAPFDLTEPDGLRGFLQAQSRAVIPLEDALEADGIGDVLPDWPARRRSAMLRGDLALLGAVSAVPSVVPTLVGHGQRIGALYVLEGSRLGGKLLARRVAQAGRQPPLPTGFLLQHAGPGAWASFLACLDAPCWICDDLLAGATMAFEVFHNAAVSQAEAIR